MLQAGLATAIDRENAIAITGMVIACITALRPRVATSGLEL